MPKIFDRYLVREILPPFLLGLLVLTFLVEIPTMVDRAAGFIAQGIPWTTVAHLLFLLLPSALSNTIPMAVLLGILIAFGRLSGDREFVAMQACGVSVFRVLRPVAFVALAGLAATAYEIIVALPNANQTFREITLDLVGATLEKNVKPRVFFIFFPNVVIYVRDVPQDGGWRDVFLADMRQAGTTLVYVAREGRVSIDRAAKTVQLQLKSVSRHKMVTGKSDDYEALDSDTFALTLDPTTVFKPPPPKGPPESTIAELRHLIEEQRRIGQPAQGERFMLQYKFSFPLSCLALGLIGLGLGMSSRKDGKLASFALGSVVIFLYYILLYMARAAAIGGKLSADLAPWIPHLVIGTVGVVLLFWRARSADQPIRIGLPALWRPRTTGDAAPRATASRRVVVVIRLPHLRIPKPRLLDLYVSRQYLSVFGIALVSLLGVFYIATFIDMADKLFRGQANTGMLLRYFYYQTPQFVYYVIPMAGLVAALVTIGVMTKNSELIVMRACGVSLYRTAAPLLMFALLASLALFGLEERVLARANTEADRLNTIIRTGAAVPTLDTHNRRWMAGQNGDIYYYDTFIPAANRFDHFTVYDLNEQNWRLSRVTYADNVRLEPRETETDHPTVAWKATNGWSRTFTTAARRNGVTTAVPYAPFPTMDLALEPPAYFRTETPDALKMTYGQLSEYVDQLKASGTNAVPQMVQLQGKLAFPLVTVIMTLIAVPFAVTTGRRGALYGVGIGIVLAIVYRVVQIVFGALGEAGAITPVLAAWAPNILFGAGAVYGILTVRT